MLMPIVLVFVAFTYEEEMFSKTQILCVMAGYVGVLMITNPWMFEGTESISSILANSEIA